MKKLTALLLCLILLTGLLPSAGAAYVSASEAAGTLNTLGLFQGTGSGYELDRVPTRSEAVVMVVRLLGAEEEALGGGWPCPFTDVSGQTADYVGYAYAHGLLKGVGSAAFGGSHAVTAKDYLTFTLRALGYSEAAGDFTYDTSISFADAIGLTHGEYGSGIPFIREDIALVTYTALTVEMKDGGGTLIERLVKSGAVSGAAVERTRLAAYANAGKTAYSAEQIYEMASSAVFYLEGFETKEALDKGFPTSNASGFFISRDGAAVISYHEVQGMRYARITTTDGKSYDVESVLYYDTYQDIMVVRISRTATDGSTVRFFPYLKAGNSDAVGNGSAVYTLSSPLGLKDCISSGIVSNKSRNVDDPVYPLIQFTAPISSGSSGGVLLNEYGEAIGVLEATYIYGQNLNLAIPLNCISSVSLSSAGISLLIVYDTEAKINAIATLTASETSLRLGVGETAIVKIVRNNSGIVSLKYGISNEKVVSCQWGQQESKAVLTLAITGEAVGHSTVTVNYAKGCGNADAAAVIDVTVTG